MALDGDAPLGQRTLYWPGTRHIACMAQNKQGIHNSMLLECVSFDAENVTLRNLEGEAECLHAGVLPQEPSERAGIHNRERAPENDSRNHRLVRSFSP